LQGNRKLAISINTLYQCLISLIFLIPKSHFPAKAMQT
jgi:hypothetical protein